MECNNLTREDLYDSIKGMSPKERQILIDTFIHEASMLAFSLELSFRIDQGQEQIPETEFNGETLESLCETVRVMSKWQRMRLVDEFLHYASNEAFAKELNYRQFVQQNTRHMGEYDERDEVEPADEEESGQSNCPDNEQSVKVKENNDL